MRRWKGYQENGRRDTGRCGDNFSYNFAFPFCPGPTQSASTKRGDMFKKTKSKVLVDYASEEDDMSWHYDHKVMTPIKTIQL